jgi:hypothetical protein
MWALSATHCRGKSPPLVSNLGITSVYLYGIDTEVIETVAARAAPMIPVRASRRLEQSLAPTLADRANQQREKNYPVLRRLATRCPPPDGFLARDGALKRRGTVGRPLGDSRPPPLTPVLNGGHAARSRTVATFA